MKTFICFAFLRKTPLFDKIVRGEYEGGLFNGYVAFSDILPYDTISYWPESDESFNPIDWHINVHGGLTYDRTQSEDYMPMIPLTAIPDPSCFKGLRVIGFDTLHLNDSKEMWDFEAVKKETMDMYEQVVKLLEEHQEKD